MISDTKYKELIKTFVQMKEEQVRVVALLALERMWKPFEKGLLETSKELKSDVRRCLDILWQQALHEVTEELCTEYMDCLEDINDRSDEEDPEDGLSTVHPLYLIGQLYSGILSSQGGDLKKACAGCTVRPLDMICDGLFDQYGDDAPLETLPAVQEELKRIDHDIQLVNRAWTPPYTEIIKQRAEYQQLAIVPVS